MKKFLYTCLMTIAVLGCDDRLEDLNTDKKNPAEVPPESLFTGATRELVDNIYSMSVNDNPFRLYSQMWSQTTYPEESQYIMSTREIPYNIYVNQYRDVLSDIMTSREIIEEELAGGESLDSDENLTNKMAIIDILVGYTYTTLVDIFGDVPYSEALGESQFPVYDDAAAIYDAVEASISAASSQLTTNASAGGFGDADVVYGGSVAAWAKFANTLKLRMAMRLADVNSAKSIEWANEAMTAGVFTSNGDNFSMAYESGSPNSSPLHEDLVLSGRADFVASNTLTGIMNDLLDPRMMVYTRGAVAYGWNVDEDGLAQDSTFTQNLFVLHYDEDGNLTSTTSEAPGFTLLAADSATTGDIRIYQGGVYGDNNTYSACTQVGAVLHLPATPGVLMQYAEVEFLMAEMAERGGYSITGTAEDHYNAGITASFDQWGVAGAAAYLANPDVAYATADGGSGDWKQIIGIQMWLGLYNQGLEAWTTWRRLDFDAFTPPPGMTMADIPVRMTYPLREATLNGTNLEAAQAKITGGDEVSSKIFWDAN